MTLTVALAGNPNVGKSTLFNQLTGSRVETAHYAGTTLEVAVAETQAGKRRVRIVDLPGAYSLLGRDEAEVAAREALLQAHPDSVVVVVDAGNLARNLALVLELGDAGAPVVVALNLIDEAARSGTAVDADALASALGVPVVPTVAVQGTGVAELFDAALRAAESGWSDPLPRYDAKVETALAEVASSAARMPQRPWGLPPRALALQAVEGREPVLTATAALPGGRETVAAALLVRGRIALGGRAAIAAKLARERHSRARRFAEGAVSHAPPARRRTLASITTSPLTGVPILLAMLAGVFGMLFVVGGALATGFEAFWSAAASPPIQAAVHATAGEGILGRTLLWGLDAGVEASLSIGLPYILTFYVMLALLEDSGYLGSAAFLADRVMHRFGLHGRAVIPLVAAAGCNVPAVIGTRSLGDGRERTIAATLAVMVPCSARSAVILGAAGRFLGWAPAAGVFAVTAVLTFGVGLALDRWMPGRGGGLVMEVFPFRRPAWRPVLRKAWDRFREFLFVATPIVIVGSLVLGGLYETDRLWALTGPLEPVVEGWLGLPAVAGLTLLFGLLRKELALQLLATLAIARFGATGHDLLGFMSRSDVFVYALVNTLAIPCISTVAVLGRELGVRKAALVVAMTIAIALAAGGAFARALPLLGW
ncbi:MAG: ferrous iron transport protein B [Coriobacteriia bacterium]|nr:ferrous iron transport protein B [Coriobacteriia bacterium]